MYIFFAKNDSDEYNAPTTSNIRNKILSRLWNTHELYPT